MLVFALAYLAGALTILSPCILPVLPFVFVRSDRPFARNGLPLLLGMAVTFTGVATLAAVGGGWAAQVNGLGREVALAVLALCGVALLSPALAERLTRPLVAAGARLSQAADAESARGGEIGPSFLLGVATGLLWAPCAGPILGVILSGAALNGANVETTLLLFTYAAGAATSLAAALLLGGRVFAAMKRSLGLGQGLRRGLGVAVLAGVVIIGFEFDGLLTEASITKTATLEHLLLEKLEPTPAPASAATAPLPVTGVMPALTGATDWLNSPALTTEGLRGKVVLVDFWTYTCINCLRTLPYLRGWAERYRDAGLVVIGIHTPEFSFEQNIEAVRRAVERHKINYPVAIDNKYTLWRAYANQYWPAHYLIDALGRIRSVRFGEGDTVSTEQDIRQLLVEAGQTTLPPLSTPVILSGIETPPSTNTQRSPETYVSGAEERNSFASPEGMVLNQARVYSTPKALALNEWALDGDWTLDSSQAKLNRAHGRIVYHFSARDLNLVLAPAAADTPVRFRVRIDGRPPGRDHGFDTDGDGVGTITEKRLFQLVRQAGVIAPRTFDIEFLDPGVEAFAFTFG